MAWETRKGRQYYYRSVRTGGRVVKEYVGCAAWVGAVARLDALDRQRAEDERARSRAALARWDRIDEAVATGLQEAQAVVSAVLMEAGYHRHDRGAWRKKRMAKDDMRDIKQEQAVRRAVVPETTAERIKITRDALRGDKKQEDAAIACIRQYPDEMNIGFFKGTGAILDLIAGESRVFREIVRQEAKSQQAALEGENPTPLESLLVERIVACSLHVSYAERNYALNMGQNGLSLAQVDSLQKRIDRAHRRHLSAIKTLAQVRRLQLPAVSVALPGSTQINVGEKQVNMAGSGASQING